MNLRNLSKILIILMLSSCGSTKIIEMGGKAASKGTDVAQKVLDIYVVMEKQAELDRYQQNRAEVLINPDPATMDLPDKPARSFKLQLEPRIKAYQSLLNVYKAFVLLTDSKYGDKTEEAVNALQESYDAISSLPDIPPVVTAKLPDVSKKITLAIQAKKIKRHNEILVALTEAYITLWDADQVVWNNYLDEVSSSYWKTLSGLKADKFDAKKILANSKEPYSNEAALIQLERLKQRDEIIKQTTDIKDQLNDIGKALKELNKAHVEISKSKPDISDVIDILNNIENLLTEKE